MVLEAMYEIEIGCDFNSRTVIRRCHECPAMATDNSPGRLSATGGRLFWVLYYQGILAVGSGDAQDPFLVWIDRQPLEVNHVGFTTDGVEGTWKFSKYPGVFSSRTSGDSCVLYPFEKLPVGNFEVTFALKWTGATSLQLAEEPKSDNCYYIVLEHTDGGKQISAKVRLKDQTIMTTTHTPAQLMGADDPAEFYLKLDGSTLQLGESRLDPFLEIPGANVSYLRHLGYSSFISDTADWYFFDMIPNVVGYTDEISEIPDCLLTQDIQVFYTDGQTPSTYAVRSYTPGEYELGFKIQSEGRARMMFSDSPTGDTDGYNIVFDGGNSSGEPTSYISLNGEILQRLDEDILSSSTNKPFFVRYSHETLAVGHKSGPPILIVSDVPYKDVQFIRFQTEEDEVGRWTFYDVEVESSDPLQPVPHNLHVYSYHTSGATQSLYPFSPLSSKKFELVVDVRTNKNAFVVLSPLPVDQESYTFVFDQLVDGERSSAVLHDDNVVDNYATSFLSRDEYASFYIKMRDSSLLMGQVGEEPILQVQGVSSPLPRYVSFGNLNGDATQWRFYNVTPAAKGQVQIYLQTLESPVYDLRIPPGDTKIQFSALVTDVSFLYFSPEPKLDPSSGYKFAFANSDGLRTSRVDVSYQGVAIASYSGDRLSLSDRAYFYVQLVGKSLDFGIDGEETPLLHLSDIDRDSFKYIGLQRTTAGIDLWTFFGLHYVGDEGDANGEETATSPAIVTKPKTEPPAISPNTVSRRPIFTRPPVPSLSPLLTGVTGNRSSFPVTASRVVDAVGEGHTLPNPAQPGVDPSMEISAFAVDVTTEGATGYRYKIGPLDLMSGSRGQFSVQAEKNAAVGLLSRNGSDADYYEILIGSEDNLKTQLQKCVATVCYTVLDEDTPYILKSIKQTMFYVEAIPSIDGSLKIRVGTGGPLDAENGKVLLAYEDSDPLKIEYVGIRTYDVWGKWTIFQKLLLPEELETFQTPAGSKFHSMTMPHPGDSESINNDHSNFEGVGRFEFSVVSDNEAIVALSSTATGDEQPDRYEIEIGADGNRKIVLRRCVARNCTLLETVVELGVLNPGKPTFFFLEVSCSGESAIFIRLGRAGGIDSIDRSLLQYTATNPVHVTSVNFRTPLSLGTWVINHFVGFDSKVTKFESRPSDGYLYRLGPFTTGEKYRLEFSIQADCGAEVVFTPKSSDSVDNYTLAIGTDGNQKTTVTKCESETCSVLHVVETPNILSSIFPAYFFADMSSKDGTSTARFGRANLAGSLRSEGSTLLVFEDSDPIHVTYAGFRTAECTGTWTTAIKVSPKSEVPAESIEPESTPLYGGVYTETPEEPATTPPILNEEPVDKVTFTSSGDTIDGFRYEIGPIVPLKPSRFEFYVTAESDAVVVLAPEANADYPSYKLHIGAKENTETHVMRCRSTYYCPALLTVQTPAILKSTAAVKFFVELVKCSSTNKLNIRLGLSGSLDSMDSEVLDYEDADPLAAVSAGFGTIAVGGRWTVYRFVFYSGTTLITLFKTGHRNANYWYPSNYRVLRNDGEMKFSFSVAAEKNALIALSDQPSAFDATDVVQIRLGVDDNRRSTISRNNQEVFSTATNVGHLSTLHNATFWVSVDGGIIEVGAEGSDRFMAAEFGEPIGAKYIWFVSGERDKVTYHWMFYKYFYYSSHSGHLESTHDIDIFKAHIYEQATLDEKFEYTFNPVHSNYFGKYTTFSVSAEGSIHIALSAAESTDDEMYEIVFGGERNTKATLQRCSSCEAVVTAYSKDGFVLAQEQKKYLITLYDGTISVYEEHAVDPVLEWNDPKPLPVDYAGFSLKSSASFVFYPAASAAKYNDEAPSPWYYAIQLTTDKKWQIILSSSAQTGGEVYDIVFGTKGNTRSEIRRGHVPVATADGSGVLSTDDPKFYWFAVEGNVISAGVFDPVTANRCAPFISYEDPDLIRVPLFRVSTGDVGATFNFSYGNGKLEQLPDTDPRCAP